MAENLALRLFAATSALMARLSNKMDPVLVGTGE